MKMRLLALLLLLLVGTAGAKEVAPGISDADFKTMDAMVDRAMAAYNKGDFKGFYADWAKMMAGVATKEAFQNVYVDQYQKKFGTYKSRKLIASRCTSGPMNALLVYQGTFSQGPGVISFNYFKENGTWKVQQIQINKS